MPAKDDAGTHHTHHRCADCHRVFKNVVHRTTCPNCGGPSMCALGGDCT